MSRTPNFVVNNIGLNDTFVLIKHRDYGVIAYHFQREIGGTSSADIGGPYEAWRRTGEWGLGSFDTNPYSSDRKVIGNDVGAYDYAFYSVANGCWGGSYHGGETITSMSGPDLSRDGQYESFVIYRESTITYDNGDTIEVQLKNEIKADGSFSERMKISSDDEFLYKMIGMEIGSGPAWTQYSIDGGKHWIDMSALGQYDLGTLGHVMLRNSDTGQTIDSDSNAYQHPDFDEAYIVQSGTRAKLYYSFDRGTIGNITVTRDVSFDYATKNVTIESDRSFILGEFDKNLILTGADAIDARGNYRANFLIGNDAINHIVGGRGDDKLRGGLGLDELRGGGGHDTFRFALGTDSDVIDDFKHGEDDIAFTGLGRFSDLVIAQNGADVKLTIGDLDIIVSDADVADFTKRDFSFG